MIEDRSRRSPYPWCKHSGMPVALAVVREETAMVKRVVFCGVFVLSAIASISATVVAASSLTERMDSRMTILKTDLSTGRFLCVEHGSWTSVVTSTLRGRQPGDIVRVDQRGGEARLVVLRTAAEELGSPE